MLLFRAFLPPAPPFPAFFPLFLPLYGRYSLCVSYRSGERLEIIIANNPSLRSAFSRLASFLRVVLLLLRNFIYVLLGNSATNKLTVEKIFLYTNIIYNIHIYNLGVDARIHALQARSNSRNACIRAYTCSRLIYFSGSSIHSLTLSRSRSTHSLGHARTRSLCVRGTIYIFYRV